MPTRQQVTIPEGSSGDFAIRHFNGQTTDYNWERYLIMKNEIAEAYTVLTKEGCPMPIMQDSYAEYKEHQWLWDNATGDVLVGGLGIGMLHQKLIDNPNVTSVTIIELEQDVVDLVWEHCIKDDSFTLVVADFETWNPPEGSSFDTVWGDTWLVDNSLTMKDYSTLIRDRYSQYTPNIGFWGE
tara:strand:+ start:404 stop:952 length:549 start_codon:yes stop_codon:yes gene_type:complete